MHHCKLERYSRVTRSTTRRAYVNYLQKAILYGSTYPAINERVNFKQYTLLIDS